MQEANPIARHWETVVRDMDRGDRSPEYRASVAYLREHPSEAVHHVRGDLLRETGTFRKWQLTYLLGEIGDERAIALLETVLEAPLPAPRPVASGRHAIDLKHAEEVRVRFRAVASIARNAGIRPGLQDRAVASLVDIGRRTPFMTSAVIFELRTLLGDDAYALRSTLGPEHAHEFDRFMPPPRWQRLMSERMQERESDPHLEKDRSWSRN